MPVDCICSMSCVRRLTQSVSKREWFLLTFLNNTQAWCLVFLLLFLHLRVQEPSTLPTTLRRALIRDLHYVPDP